MPHDVELPAEPEELIAIRGRRQRLRAQQRKDLEGQLANLQAELAKLGDDAESRRLAAELASGDRALLTSAAAPEQADAIRRKLEIVKRAEGEVARQLAAANADHNQQIAIAYLDLHREAVAELYKALRAAERANERERSLRAAAGVQMVKADFPLLRAENIEYWADWVWRHGLLDDGEPKDIKDEAPAPVRLLKGAAKAVRKRANGAAQAEARP